MQQKGKLTITSQNPQDWRFGTTKIYKRPCFLWNDKSYFTTTH